MWSIVEWPKDRRLAILGILLSLVVLGELGAQMVKLQGVDTAPGSIVLDAFEQHSNGKFPTNWRSAGSGAEHIYRIETDGDNRFLHARAENRGTQIGLEYVFDPKKLQHLQWRWRVRALPVGADERVTEKHDAAAQVYVIFDSRYWPRIIKFIWSTALPIGSRFTHPLYHRGRVVVLRSGPPDKSGWYDEKVNFYAEYKKFFGNEPGQVQGIAILTSSDSTKSLAAADYDDFVLVP
jgi:Protein of unknown function (DUF3047)